MIFLQEVHDDDIFVAAGQCSSRNQNTIFAPPAPDQIPIVLAEMSEHTQVDLLLNDLLVEISCDVQLLIEIT